MKQHLITKLAALTTLVFLLNQFISAQDWHLQNSNHTSQLKGIQMISPTEGWACGDAGAMLHTIDAGNTWSLITLTGSDLHQIVFKDASNGIVVGDNGTIYVTTNGGTNWIAKSSNTSSQLRGAAYAGGSIFYAVGDDGAATKSIDNGNTWTALISGTTERLLCVTGVDQHVWVGARNGLMLFSNNGGSAFNSMNNPATDDIKDIQFINGSIGFAGGSNSFFMYTSNGGMNWTSRSAGIQFGLNGLHFVNQNEGWVVGGVGTLYSTTNAGVNWIAIQSGTGQDINSIYSFDGVNAWAVGNAGIIVTNYSPTTDVENESNLVPSSMVLEQNYPNPFNPSTKIKYQIAASNPVSLKVYNVLGNEVATLVNEIQSTGNYEVTFDASSLSSGTYFYKLQAGSFIESRKMILLK